MQRCIRNCVLSVVLLLSLTQSAQACCFFPLLDPFYWLCGLGHHNPAATRQCIDDWFGYGYLRGQAGGSLGHYPLRPWNVYTPMYPRLHSPGMAPAPFAPAPMLPHMAMPAPMPAAPMPFASPLPPMGTLPFSNDCGCGDAIATPMPWQPPAPAYPFMPGGDPCDPCQACEPDPCCPAPMPVQVPVTTYRPVTVDRGNWQMVWVPRPVTQLVPQTSWQTQYLPSPGMYSAPMTYPMPVPGGLPVQGGCGDTPCGTATSYSPGTAALQPFGSSAYYSPAMARPSVWPTATAARWPAPAGRWPSTAAGYPVASSAWQPARPWQPTTAWQPQAAWQPATAWAPGSAWQPSVAYQAAPAYPAAPTYQAAAAYPSASAWQPLPGNRVAMGELWGDHEYPGNSPARTGVVPVTPNSYRGAAAPILRTSMSRPVRTASVNKYPNVVR